MTSITLDTDLLTPLAAYLRLRGSARASFLLESVDQGRLGRHSFVGCGDRLVSFEEAERLGEPVVGYLGYDHIAKLEPTVPLPAAGPDVPESLFVVADTFLRFDHVTGTADVLHGDPARVAAALAREPRSRPRRRAPSTARRSASPTATSTCAAIARVQEHIRRGDAFQAVLSQRAERRDLGQPARRLPRTAPHQPVAVPLPARARRARARRLVTRDARQGRGQPREPEPDRRHDRSAATATPSACSPRRRTAPST